MNFALEELQYCVMYELRIHVKHVVLYSKPSTIYFYIHKMNRIVANRLYLPPTRVVVFLFVQYKHKVMLTKHDGRRRRVGQYLEV